MPAPRTNLILLPLFAVGRTRADAVTAGVENVDTAAATGVEVHVRVANPRAERLREDLDAAVGAGCSAVLLAETLLPQDLRDADVELRRQELQHDLVPGQVGLIPEIGSAAALARLPQLLAAVDRLVSVGVDIEAVVNDLGAPNPAAAAVHWPLLGQIAVAATAARVPWTVGAMGFTAGQRAALASRARAFGADGVYVTSEAEVVGMNALFGRRS
ncbi:MAG: aldolase/citrate lyase family protein [Chloroflexi bacterium]|nr:aldolase/citrate lyase family protein [Chloroflexota bacterium]